MIIHVKKEQDIVKAITTINDERAYAKNIKFGYAPAFVGKDRNGLLKYRLVLRTRERGADLPGIAYSASGRKTSSACWHAHGFFFDIILSLGGWIEAGGRKIKEPSDNWQDYNVGSIASPLFASNACHCAFNGTLSAATAVNRETAE